MSKQTTETRPKARYHTAGTAAERMEVSTVTVKKWCQDPDKRQYLGAFKMGGEWKIPFDHLETLIERAQSTGSLF